MKIAKFTDWAGGALLLGMAGVLIICLLIG